MSNKLKAVGWTERGHMMDDAGDVGGDIQVGAAPGRRFVHSTLPGRVVDVTAYPVLGDDSTLDIPAGGIVLQLRTETTICTDVDDPGGTEVWSQIEYSDLPERFAFVYPSVAAADIAARTLIASFEPYHIGWDGCPAYTLDT